MNNEQKYLDTKMKPVEGLQVHEAADMFPMMSAGELEVLAHDIKENGMQQPIILNKEGKVIDGRNRISACRLLGRTTVEARTCYMEGAALTLFVISENLHRRHLTEAQRADIAARLAAGKLGGDRSRAPIGALTQAEAAEKLKVSERNVQRAKVVQTQGVPELLEAMREGELSVSAAAEVAQMPAEEQSALLEQGPGAVVAKVKEVRKKREATPTSDSAADAGKKHDTMVGKILQLYDCLPDEHQMQLIRRLAEKSPIIEWLAAQKEEPAQLEFESA